MSIILICHPSSHIFNIPCVVQLTQSLAKITSNDLHFGRIINSNNNTPDGGFGNNISVHDYPIRQDARKESALHWFVGYTIFLFMAIRKIRPQVLIGMGIKGLCVAWLLSRITKIPFVCYSLEFYANPKKPSRQKLLNAIERYLMRSCNLLIIHDKNRLELYESLMGRKFPNHTFFPNAPIEVKVRKYDLNLVARKFAIDANKRYLIYAGGLYPGVGLDRLCLQLFFLPSEWCLILQSHDGVNLIAKDSRLDELLTAGRLIINTKPLTPVEYAALLSYCQIGIAFYDPSDPNMANVGLSSGKIAAYWRHGLPVLVNNIPFYRDLLPKEKAGEIYENFDSILANINNIISDYQSCREGALRCFKVYFTLDEHTKQLNYNIHQAAN